MTDAHLSRRGRGAALAATVGLTLPASALMLAPTAMAAPDGGTTTITLRVSGCEGCTLRPKAWLQEESGAQPWASWNGPKLRVRKGKATFTVPTAYTNGLSLEIRAPWMKGDIGAVPLVALSQGTPSADDPTFIEGNHCWTGTTASTAQLAITVRKVTVDGMGGKAVAPMAYLTSVGAPPYIPGHQDEPYCVVPPPEGG